MLKHAGLILIFAVSLLVDAGCASPGGGGAGENDAYTIDASDAAGCGAEDVCGSDSEIDCLGQGCEDDTGVDADADADSGDVDADGTDTDGGDVDIRENPDTDETVVVLTANGRNCVVDADCGAGNHCTLRRCVAACESDDSCGGDAPYCDARGRCTTSPDRTESMPEIEIPRTTVAEQRVLTVAPRSLRYSVAGVGSPAPQQLVVKVSGYVPGEEADVVVEADSEGRWLTLLDLDDREGGLILPKPVANSDGEIEVFLNILVDGDRLQRALSQELADPDGSEDTTPLPADVDDFGYRDGQGRVTVRTVAGEQEIRVVAASSIYGIYGEYAGYLMSESPLSGVVMPLSLRVWANGDPTEDVCDVIVELRKESNPWLLSDHVVAGEYFPSSGQLSFSIEELIDNAVIAPETGSVDNVPVDGDLLLSDLVDSMRWFAFESNGIPNPWGRTVYRNIAFALELQGDASDTGRRLGGTIAESLVGAADYPVVIWSDASIDLGRTQRELIADGYSRPAGFDRPVADVVPVAAELGIPDLTACETVCLGERRVNPYSSAAEFLRCAETADESAVRLVVEAGASLGQRLENAYEQCTNTDVSAASRVLPESTGEISDDCVNAAALNCAYAAYRAASQRATSASNQIAAWRGMFRMLTVVSDAYRFLANDYMSFAVDVTVTGRFDSRSNRSSALRLAANSVQVAAAARTNPYALAVYELAPNDELNDDLSPIVRFAADELRDAIGVVALSMRSAGQAIREARTTEWTYQLSRVDGDARGTYSPGTTETIRRAAILGWIQGALLARHLDGRQVAWGPERTEYTSALDSLLRQFVAVQSGWSPLDLPIERLSSLGVRESAVSGSLFEAEYRRATGGGGTTSNLARLEDAEATFDSTRSRYALTETTLNSRVTEAVERANSQLARLCGSSLAQPQSPFWDPGERRPRTVAPNEAEIGAYNSAMESYLQECAARPSINGTIAQNNNDVAALFLAVQRANAEFDANQELVSIEIERLTSVVEANEDFLDFEIEQLDGQLEELSAREVAIRDQAERERKARRMFGFVSAIATAVVGVGAVVSGLPIGASLIKNGVTTGIGAATAGVSANAQSSLAQIAAARTEVENRQRMAVANTERTVSIEEANSQARVSTLLTQNAVHLLNIEIAGAELQGGIMRQAAALAEVERVFAARDRTIEEAVTGYQGEALLRYQEEIDDTVAEYFDLLLETRLDLFQLAQVFTYEMGFEPGVIERIISAESHDELERAAIDLDDAYDCYRETVGVSDTHSEDVSLRRDVLGWRVAFRDPITDTVYTSAEQFSRYLLDPANFVSTEGAVRIRFSTSLRGTRDADEDELERPGVALSSVGRCADFMTTIAAMAEGDQLGATRLDVSIRVGGTGTVRSCSSGIRAGEEDVLISHDLTDLGATAQLSVPVGAMSDARQGLVWLPVGASDWALTIRLPGSSSDPDSGFRVENLTDIVLRVGSRAFALESEPPDLELCRQR